MPLQQEGLQEFSWVRYEFTAQLDESTSSLPPHLRFLRRQKSKEEERVLASSSKKTKRRHYGSLAPITEFHFNSRYKLPSLIGRYILRCSCTPFQPHVSTKIVFATQLTKDHSGLVRGI